MQPVTRFSKLMDLEKHCIMRPMRSEGQCLCTYDFWLQRPVNFNELVKVL